MAQTFDAGAFQSARRELGAVAPHAFAAKTEPSDATQTGASSIAPSVAVVSVEGENHDLAVRYAIIGIFVILLVGALEQTKPIAVPVVAGIVVGLVLGPLVDWLAARRIPQHAAAGVIILAMIGIMGIALTALASPIATYSDRLPEMISTLRTKLVDVFSFARRVEQIVTSASPGVPKVEVASGSPWLGVAMGSSSLAGGLLLFTMSTYFYLATRRHMKARVLRLCLGRAARQSAGQFFENAERQVSVYLGVVSLINLAVGAIAIVLAWAAGLPFPIVWGAIAFLLNYVAFVGPAIMTALLFAAGLVAQPTIFDAAWPAALYLVIHAIEGNVVTPMLVGRKLTISPFLVFLSFVFWLWLWGPVGAVLSAPFLVIGYVAMEAVATYREADALEKLKEAALLAPATAS